MSNNMNKYVTEVALKALKSADYTKLPATRSALLKFIKAAGIRSETLQYNAAFELILSKIIKIDNGRLSYQLD